MIRADVEKILVDRCGPYMVKAGMAVNFDGLNADLDDPLRVGWLASGLELAGNPTATDALLAPLPDSILDEVLDRAEYATFTKIQTRRKTTSVQITGSIQTYDSDLLRQINEILKRLKADILEKWGPPQTGNQSGLVYWHDPTAAREDDFDLTGIEE